MSGPTGAFELTGIAPGEHLLKIATVGYRLLQTRVAVEAGWDHAIEVSLTPDSFQRTDRIDVRADPFELERPLGPTEFAIDGGEAKNLAGVLADDPLRAVAFFLFTILRAISRSPSARQRIPLLAIRRILNVIPLFIKRQWC